MLMTTINNIDIFNWYASTVLYFNYDESVQWETTHDENEPVKNGPIGF